MLKKIFIFPLSSSMTLCHVSLPYHIFEERYRKMLDDALADNTPISVLPSSLFPYEEKSVFAGIPKLIHRYEDGRSDIVVSGDYRVKVKRITENDYLMADVEGMSPLKELSSSTDISLIREALGTWVDHQDIDRDQKDFFRGLIADNQIMLAYATSLLVKPEREKTNFLGCESWDEWTKLLIKKIGPNEIELGPYLAKLKF
jgi:Lon protease-like protein